MKSESAVASNVETTSAWALAPSHPVELLHERLGFGESFVPPAASRGRALHEWRMEENDAPILRYLYRNLRPRRHLEFGTWEGRGSLACLEECDATVWSINLREGETNDEGRWAYDAWLDEFGSVDDPHRAPLRQASASRLTGDARPSLVTRTARNGRTVVRTDALGAIGHLVHEAGLGHRLCQIYCDSRAWDGANYPDGFFDSALIDGGHTTDVVAGDTCNALRLVRSGGLLLWHDYCPDAMAQASSSSIAGVIEAMRQMAPTIERYCADWFWIEPSWILVGVRNGRVFDSVETRR